jgi:outer membrane lipoprotein-sorting protein
LLRKLLCGCIGLALLGAGHPGGELPGWWNGFRTMARLESGFVQQSDSAVFGKLRRQGQLKLAKGGHLRVEYRPGILLVADGHSLVQYDPEARTAQRISLQGAVADTPLINILLNPGALGGFYEARPGPGQSVSLEPRRPGLPRVVLTGSGGLLQRIQWQDATGASQEIELQNPHIPAPFAASVFNFQPPAGTRWLGPR